jgi:hypothetical protein
VVGFQHAEFFVVVVKPIRGKENHALVLKKILNVVKNARHSIFAAKKEISLIASNALISHVRSLKVLLKGG